MSKLAEFKALEAQLAAQLKQLEAMKEDERLKREIEFENKLKKLMSDYGVGLKAVIQILDPASGDMHGTRSSGGRRARQLKVFKNPHTGETVETKGGNHKTLKQWKEEYGAQAVATWQV